MPRLTPRAPLQLLDYYTKYNTYFHFSPVAVPAGRPEKYVDVYIIRKQ